VTVSTTPVVDVPVDVVVMEVVPEDVPQDASNIAAAVNKPKPNQMTFFFIFSSIVFHDLCLSLLKFNSPCSQYFYYMASFEFSLIKLILSFF
jgi:hypothetical protein